MKFFTFGMCAGQKFESGVDFSAFKVDFGQKLEKGVDLRINFTPSRLFWPQTTTGWLSITLQPIQSLYSRPFPILLLKFSPKTEGCHKSQGPWHPYR